MEIFKNKSQNFLENSEFITMMSGNLQNDLDCIDLWELIIEQTLLKKKYIQNLRKNIPKIEDN